MQQLAQGPKYNGKAACTFAPFLCFLCMQQFMYMYGQTCLHLLLKDSM